LERKIDTETQVLPSLAKMNFLSLQFLQSSQQGENAAHFKEVTVSIITTKGRHSRFGFLCFLCLLTAAIWTGSTFAQQKYEKPPKEILDVLNAPLPPTPTQSQAKWHTSLFDATTLQMLAPKQASHWTRASVAAAPLAQAGERGRWA
jgi:hypothetical protein